jgi:DNA polymerase
MKKIKKILLSLKTFLEQESNYGIDEYFFSESKPNKNLNKERLFIDLEKKIKNCKLCHLYKDAKKAVLGEGNLEADLMFVGEGPGREEDLQGRPFVGEAGKLLTKIIEAMNYKREEVYIANIVKHRPPQNRNPFLDEIKACLPYLLFQIQLIKPKVICALGKCATKALLRDERSSISELRGKFQVFEILNIHPPIKIMPTYHPAYLLRNPKAKREVWSDMKKVMQYLAKI